MLERAIVARSRFLDRYEMPSLWETEEVQKSLHEMYLRKVRETEAKEEAGEASTAASHSPLPAGHGRLHCHDAQMSGSSAVSPNLDPDCCHDKEKPRATVEQYTSLIGVEVAANLEAIARARQEKRPRLYQSDAAVHQAFIQARTGGGEAEEGEDASEIDTSTMAPAKTFFE